MLNIQSIRKDFPILSSKMSGRPLVYLDNAATSQKPKSVIDSVNSFYSTINSNIHRGVFSISEKATEAYESSRSEVARFLNAPSCKEVIFTKGVTESINLVASCFADQILKEGDEVLITHMEHHANIVPWQLACKKTGAVLKVVEVLEDGTLDMNSYRNLISNNTKLVSVVHVSNSLGTINPVNEIINIAHSRNIPVLVDGAQSTTHLPIDVQLMDCDFFVFSGHKLLGPTGVGVLYGKESWLSKFSPYQSGGDMIEKVSFEGTSFKDIPGKFEAGTPNIAGVIGLSEAIKYMSRININDIIEYEKTMIDYANDRLRNIPGLKIIGDSNEKTSIFSFVFDGIHAHDIGTFLNADGIAIRTGHHCTMPLLERYEIAATARASFSFYNTIEEVDVLSNSLQKMIKVFL